MKVSQLDSKQITIVPEQQPLLTDKTEYLGRLWNVYPETISQE